MFAAIVSVFAFGFGLVHGSPVIVFAAVSLGYCVALSGMEYPDN